MAERRRDRGWRSGLASLWSRLHGPLGPWPRRVALALMALELVYLIAGNAFLNTEAGMAVLNRKPEKVRVAFERAWTPLPGLVRVRGLELAGDSRRVSWSTRIDRAWTFIWIPSLALKHVRIVSGRPAGVDIAIDVLPKPDEPRPRRPGRGWKVTLGGLHVDELRRLAVEEYEIVAAESELGSVRGWVQFQVRGPMTLRVDRVRFEDATVHSLGATVAERLRLDAGFTTEPWRVALQGVDELIAGTTGEVVLAAQVDNLAFLDAYLRKLPWLRLGGSGELALDLEIERGSVLAGSSMALVGDEVVADFFDFRARGRGRVAGGVDSETGDLRLGATLDELEVDRSSDGARMLVGDGLEVLATISSPLLYQPPEDVAGVVRLASARAEDLSRFGPYFPGGLQFDLEGGTAELSMDLAYDTAARSGQGRLDVDFDDVAATYDDARVAVSGALDIELPALDLVGGRFDLAGTRLELGGGRIEHRGKVRSEDWSARLSVPTGVLDLPPHKAGSDPAEASEPSAASQSPEPTVPPEPPEPSEREPRAIAVAADLVVEMSDSAPVVVIMEQRLPKLRFVDWLLTIPDVELEGRVEARQRTLSLQGVEVSGGKEDQLTILLDLDLAGEETTGVAYVRYRALDASVVLDGDGRDWGLVRPRRVFEQGLAAHRARRARSGD